MLPPPLGLNTTIPMTFPPLPSVPEPSIFYSTYADKIRAVFNDSSFPPFTPPATIYYTRRKVVDMILASRRAAANNLSFNLLAAWISMVLLCGFLLVRIRRNRARALRGDVDAAHKIVLPAFEPLLWILGLGNLACTAVYGIFRLAGDLSDYYNRFTLELAFDVKLVSGLVVIAYMLQPSLSRRSLLRGMCFGLVLSTYTVPVLFALNALETHENQKACYLTQAVTRGFLVLYLSYLVVFPPARASVRSFRLLCLYVLGMIVLVCWMAEVYRRGIVDTAEALGWAVAGYSTLLPLFVLNVLRADTEHWRGIGRRAVELQDVFRRKSGRMHERVSSQGLHVLIEMHRKFIIDFARLQFHEPITPTRSTKAVYRGFLHSKKIPVAIKVYMPSDFTDNTVAEFSHEAALCGSLAHPNILTFHGLCVCPPSICLVTELCSRSLQDAIDAQAAGRRRGCTIPLRRQQTLIDIGYLIDAARAIAYLHSFSPSFVHRDIKPSNFLIDDDGFVKLTDFGASRVLSVRSRGEEHDTRRGGETVMTVPNASTSLYTAPEVLRAHHAGAYFYGEAADVFSLGMMMWDVLHPETDVSSLGISTPALGHIDAVAAGHRPPVNPLLHAALRELLNAAWHANPRKRPTAQAIVASLEVIQEELAATMALALVTELDVAMASDKHATVAGSLVVEKMRVGGFVESSSEGVRLGSMLMDCGLLHHSKHAQQFDATTSTYVFDMEQIQLGQPLAILEASDTTPEVDSSSQSQSSRSGTKRRCACRQLGQRLATERSTRLRFLRKFKTVSDEHWLTTSLLVDDLPRATDTWAVDFTAYDEPHTPK